MGRVADPDGLQSPMDILPPRIGRRRTAREDTSQRNAVTATRHRPEWTMQLERPETIPHRAVRHRFRNTEQRPDTK